MQRLNIMLRLLVTQTCSVRRGPVGLFSGKQGPRMGMREWTKRLWPVTARTRQVSHNLRQTKVAHDGQ